MAANSFAIRRVQDRHRARSGLPPERELPQSLPFARRSASSRCRSEARSSRIEALAQPEGRCLWTLRPARSCCRKAATDACLSSAALALANAVRAPALLANAEAATGPRRHPTMRGRGRRGRGRGPNRAQAASRFRWRRGTGSPWAGPRARRWPFRGRHAAHDEHRPVI